MRFRFWSAGFFFVAWGDRDRFFLSRSRPAASRVTGDEQKEYAESRDGLAKQMTPAQIAEAQKRAADWQAAFEKRQTD